MWYIEYESMYTQGYHLIFLVIYVLYYVGQNSDLGIRARPIHRDGGSRSVHFRFTIPLQISHLSQADMRICGMFVSPCQSAQARFCSVFVSPY
jgi:hypothetical protein